MKSELKAGALLSYVTLFLNSTISILYTPIMLKLLGQSEYGLYSLAGSSVAYLGVLNFGLGSAVIRYTAKYRALKDDERCSNLFGMFFILYGVLGIIALVLGVILTFNAENIFSRSLNSEEVHKLKILMGILVANTSLWIAFDVFGVIAQAYEKFIFQKVINIAGALLNPLIMLPLLMSGHGSITMAVVFTSINLLTVLTNIFYCFKVLKLKMVFKKFETGLLKEVIVFSSFLFLNLIIEKIYWSTDQIILGIYSGTVAVSIYTVGSSFSGYFSGFSAAISNVFLSRVSGMVTKKAADKEISDLFIKIGRIQYLIIAFVLSGFAVFGREFIYLWVGNEYSQSYIIALLIVIPMVIPLIQGMGGIILQAKNMHKFRSIVYFVIAIANIFLSLLFVRWWGAVGCALATAIAFVAGNIIIMNFYYWKKVQIEIPKFWMNILFMSFPLFLSILFGITVNKLVLADNWFVFIIKIAAFSLVYILLIWFTGMNKYEKNLIIGPMKNLVKKFKKRKVYEAG